METHPHISPQSWIVHFALTRHHHHVVALGLLLLMFSDLMYQTCRYELHRQFLHRHCLQNGDQVFVRGGHTLKHGHDHVFLSHGYLQTRELIRKRFDLVDVVQ